MSATPIPPGDIDRLLAEIRAALASADQCVSLLDAIGALQSIFPDSKTPREALQRAGLPPGEIASLERVLERCVEDPDHNSR